MKSGPIENRRIAYCAKVGSIPNAVNSFGKLLVCLPAIHFGGHVLLSYDGKTEEFSTETSSHWGYSYIAW